jgi:hypothetical protein
MATNKKVFTAVCTYICTKLLCTYAVSKFCNLWYLVSSGENLKWPIIFQIRTCCNLTKDFFADSNYVLEKVIITLQQQSSLTISVTRWVCEKIAQNVAQPIFVKILHILYFGKKLSKILGHFSNFYKTDQSKWPPIGQKIAQSGPPELQFVVYLPR